jgi:hypothetical protein
MELDSYDQPNILFLRACFIGDCSNIEDLFDEHIVNQSNLDPGFYDIKDIEYDQIPERFNGIETWIQNTNLKCWSCDCNFHTIPIFIPASIERSDNVGQLTGSMDVLGNFCTWNCAMQYINLHFTGEEKWEKHELLKLLCKIFTGVLINDIIQSPPKTIMQQYGGKKTQQEYRENLTGLNDSYRISIKHNGINNITMCPYNLK